MIGNLIPQARHAFRLARRRLIHEPMARSSTVRRLVLKAEAERWESEAGLLFDCGDHVLAVHPNDITVSAAIRRERSFFRREFMQAVELIEKEGALRGSVFLDIGANVGTHTIYALKSGRFTRVVAFEPEAGNLFLLRQNLLLNELTNKVDIAPLAAGAEAGTAELWISERLNNAGHSLVAPDIAYQGRKVSIPVERVDDVLASLGIEPSSVGLIYIDIEGYEPAAMRGMTRLIEAKAPMVIEMNPERPGYEEMVQTLRENYAWGAYLTGDRLSNLEGSPTPQPMATLEVPLIRRNGRDLLVF